MNTPETQPPPAGRTGSACPHCGSGLLWSDDRGAHCDGCDEFDPETMNTPETQPLLHGAPGSGLAGIPAPTLAQQVAQLEYQRDQLNQLLGELIATCLVNLHSGSIKCDDPGFQQYVEVRSNLRMQLMGDVVSLSPNATGSLTGEKGGQ